MPESNLKVPEWGHWWVGELQVWQGTLQCHSPLHDHFVCKSVFHRWCTLHKTGTFFHQLSVSESLLTTNMGSQCLAIFICSCANFNSSYHIQNEASCGFLFPLQISSNIVRIFYCFFTCNELIWTLDGNQFTKMGIQDNALHNVHIVDFVFLPTEQVATYLKICISTYRLTYIDPNSFDWKENTFF